MPKGIPLTQEEQARRKKEIFNASVHLFLEKGFTETSMREIAEAAGIGKSTLYGYFHNKDDVLLSFFEGEVEGLTEKASEIGKQPVSALEKLRRIIFMHLDYMVENKQFYLKLAIETQRLAQESQERIQVKRYAYQDMLRGIVEEGIQDGSIRPVDPLLAARMVLNVLTPVVFASRPTGTPQEMMEEAFDIFMRGVRA
jgi:AcrR family transcriptional regulator